jgi:predicted dehydrogenase
MHPDQSTRRSFLRAAAVAAAAPAVATTPLGENVFALSRAEADEPAAKAAGPNDRVRIATVGMGIIGFIDTDTALKVPGVELVAAADLYEGRRVHAKEVYGEHVQTYVDYREILARKDVDAVLVCVPDFWHTRIAIDAMKAGKAVYCEKPMVRTVEEGPQIIAAQAETKAVFQVGSQTASSIVYDKVKELIKAGAIGPVNMIEARYNRNSSFGAWQYSIPTDASPQTVDWDRFLGSVAPRLPFDVVRFFRWRNYSDYGTAVAGDLFVHLLTGIHHATGALGPNRVSAMGGRRYWDDGRDVYDVILALLDYPDTSDHKGFTLSLQTNFEDGGGGNTLFRFVGPEGVINVSFTELTVDGPGIVKPTADQVLKGYNSVRTFSNAQQKAFAEQFLSKQPVDKPTGPKTPYRFVAPKGYDERYDHFVNFFKAVRGEKPVYEDATFGLRAAAPALLCNESYRQGRVLGWDPVALKMTS